MVFGRSSSPHLGAGGEIERVRPVTPKRLLGTTGSVDENENKYFWRWQIREFRERKTYERKTNKRRQGRNVMWWWWGGTERMDNFSCGDNLDWTPAVIPLRKDGRWKTYFQFPGIATASMVANGGRFITKVLSPCGAHPKFSRLGSSFDMCCSPLPPGFEGRSLIAYVLVCTVDIDRPREIEPSSGPMTLTSQWVILAPPSSVPRTITWDDSFDCRCHSWRNVLEFGKISKHI